MYRHTQVPRLSVTIAAFTLVGLTACTLEKDENGGRPVEVASAPITSQGTTPSATVPVTTVGNTSGNTSNVRESSRMPMDVSFTSADIAFRDKRYGDATKMFGAYVVERPENAWGHYMLGLSAWKYGDLDQARGAFEQALTLDPRHVKSLLNLTRVYLDLGQPREARTRVILALAHDSTSGEALRLKGRVHSELKQHEEAIASYRLALARNPTDVWSMNNLALILIQQQRYTEALGPLARAVALDSSVAVFQNNLGIALEHVGQYTLATVAYKGAVAADAGYTKAVMSLARVTGRMDDPTSTPVDLGTLASAFDREVRGLSGGVAVARQSPSPEGGDREQ